MGNLEEYRGQLDQIDREIVRLYEERMNISEKVAAYKIETGKTVLDRKREQEKLQAVESQIREEKNRLGARELFEQIMSSSRKRQYQMMTERGVQTQSAFTQVPELAGPDTRVVFQGAAGSYSEAAMKNFFGEKVESFGVETFRDAMISIEEGAADYAVLPIENSTAGIVSENYDLLVEFENYIVGEQIIRIEHCLMGVPGASLEDIRRVYSHPQSLAQSERFLQEHLSWQQIGMKNNAFAAQKVAQEKDPAQAAIASAYAAQAYGLEILQKGVNQARNNSTRFIIVSPRKIFTDKADKVSLCVEIAHESGALYHLLSHIIYNGLNMVKIESRPIEDRSFEYRFFIDFEGKLTDPAVRSALRGIREEARHMRILGCYTSAHN
ncbi:MAG: prephenate dehydratase [Lachnospiraceae bacterium]|nr:prephenate dehydratase [Lachnospiraceae bacterium]